MRRLLVKRRNFPTRLTIGAFAIVGIASMAALLMTRSGSSAQDVHLPNVNDSDVASAGLTIKSANEDVTITADQARATVLEANPGANVLDMRMVSLQGGRYPKPTEFWAVSLDPANAIRPRIGDTVDTSLLKTRFHVVFLDPASGKIAFNWSASDPVDSPSVAPK